MNNGTRATRDFRNHPSPRRIRHSIPERFRRTLILTASLGLVTTAHAANPIIQTIYTADPAPVVAGDTLYLYTSHDEDQLVNNFFTMKDWWLFSTKDMVNWTAHGAVASLRNFKWAGSGWGGGFENGAWAPHAIERDGKWFLYCPLHGRGIGVLVADNPFGPFTDPLGKPLIGGQYDSIDPAAFIDDDGQAYLYWGNPRCWYVKLNRDMISYDTSIGDRGLVVLDMTVEEFGKRSRADEKRATTYEEGPWLYKRDGLYYLFFAAGPIPEHLGYSTGSSPTGPWKYRGVVMKTQSAFTIHPGVVDFKGKTYLFYHNAGLPGGGGFKRSVCVDELTFNPDGSVKEVIATRQGVSPVATLDPYQRVEAETIAWAHGVEIRRFGQRDVAVTDIDDGDHILVRNVAFGERNPKTFTANLAAEKAGGTIEVRLDSLTSEPIATIQIGATGSLEQWKSFSTPVKSVTGVHDVYFTFKVPDGARFDFDHWKFE
ncbi:MAG TPA: family 43 glycosylhydrolase [Verrucomicrobia bacterium]|nr:family 43 glycosylhydrolase [Verrucomicrobiota bacterium]HOP97807.1 glycoside hydrolase family 43 protein [Verrucomicrobiota bacterium]HPU56285.1 glycoside hydrolase family 43 protein [Verrucomicrobiota bacterium]